MTGERRIIVEKGDNIVFIVSKVKWILKLLQTRKNVPDEDIVCIFARWRAIKKVNIEQQTIFALWYESTHIMYPMKCIECYLYGKAYEYVFS